MGRGTFLYNGPDGGVIDRAFTNNVTGRAAIYNISNELWITGNMRQNTASFVKTGPGTLHLAGSGTNIFYSKSGPLSDNTSGLQARYVPTANGDAPSKGYRHFHVLEGTLVLGEGGGTFLVDNGNNVGAGGWLAADGEQEKEAHLEIRGGKVQFTSGGRRAGEGGAPRNPRRQGPVHELVHARVLQRQDVDDAAEAHRLVRPHLRRRLHDGGRHVRDGAQHWLWRRSAESGLAPHELNQNEPPARGPDGRDSSIAGLPSAPDHSPTRAKSRPRYSLIGKGRLVRRTLSAPAAKARRKSKSIVPSGLSVRVTSDLSSRFLPAYGTTSTKGFSAAAAAGNAPSATTRIANDRCFMPLSIPQYAHQRRNGQDARPPSAPPRWRRSIWGAAILAAKDRGQKTTEFRETGKPVA